MGEVMRAARLALAMLAIGACTLLVAGIEGGALL